MDTPLFLKRHSSFFSYSLRLLLYVRTVTAKRWLCTFSLQLYFLLEFGCYNYNKIFLGQQSGLQGTALVTKPDYLNLIPESHTMEEENRVMQVVL